MTRGIKTFDESSKEVILVFYDETKIMHANIVFISQHIQFNVICIRSTPSSRYYLKTNTEMIQSLLLFFGSYVYSTIITKHLDNTNSAMWFREILEG